MKPRETRTGLFCKRGAFTEKVKYHTQCSERRRPAGWLCAPTIKGRADSPQPGSAHAGDSRESLVMLDHPIKIPPCVRTRRVNAWRQPKSRVHSTTRISFSLDARIFEFLQKRKICRTKSLFEIFLRGRSLGCKKIIAHLLFHFFPSMHYFFLIYFPRYISMQESNFRSVPSCILINVPWLSAK